MNTLCDWTMWVAWTVQSTKTCAMLVYVVFLSASITIYVSHYPVSCTLIGCSWGKLFWICSLLEMYFEAVTCQPASWDTVLWVFVLFSLVWSTTLDVALLESHVLCVSSDARLQKYRKQSLVSAPLPAARKTALWIKSPEQWWWWRVNTVCCPKTRTAADWSPRCLFTYPTRLNLLWLRGKKLLALKLIKFVRNLTF